MFLGLHTYHAIIQDTILLIRLNCFLHLNFKGPHIGVWGTDCLSVGIGRAELISDAPSSVDIGSHASRAPKKSLTSQRERDEFRRDRPRTTGSRKPQLVLTRGIQGEGRIQGYTNSISFQLQTLRSDHHQT